MADSMQTLLRGNSLSSKIMNFIFKQYGQDYLQAVLGPALMELVRRDAGGNGGNSSNVLPLVLPQYGSTCITNFIVATESSLGSKSESTATTTVHGGENSAKTGISSSSTAALSAGINTYGEGTHSFSVSAPGFEIKHEAGCTLNLSADDLAVGSDLLTYGEALPGVGGCGFGSSVCSSNTTTLQSSITGVSTITFSNTGTGASINVGSNTPTAMAKPVVMHRPSYEVDPTRLEPNENLEENQNNLVYATELVYSRLISSVDSFPRRLRCMCNCLYKLISQRFQGSHPDHIITVLSTIVFLRFINPAVVSPCESGLLDFEPPVRVKRGLTLLGKMMQNIANQLFFTKEPYMRIFDSVLQRHFDSCRHFFHVS
ncbi:unnamed protein product [Protopolystoma xenopodis]|uniref:Ras-GAP domain-containing protein n=1 Tax=Protopolystoma xenopodis TaxID=117903 RepID=A0A3S5BAW5_9PLAT|nr:unnamed protein product [Protopolystoma xenopodis]